MITVFWARRAVVDGGVQPAAVVVEGERIVAVLPGDTPVAGSREVVLGADEVLIPGLVDTHVHVNEPGRTEWEGFASATRAAAAGGVTTIVDMPLNSLPPTVDVAALEVKRTAADGQCAVDVGFWGGAVPGNAGELRALHEAGVFGVKCFLIDSGVPEFAALLDPAPALREVAAFGGLLIAHAEDGALVTAAAGPRYADFVASRPGASEDSAIAGLLRLAAETGARVHVVHLSSAGALPMLAAARREGVRVSVETCPHYLALTAEEVPDGDTRFKCCPPVREAGNRDALWAGLADGTIDMVVSDHSPCTPELKKLDPADSSCGDFGAAWGGIASLQLSLPVVWTEARRRGHDLADVVRWMAERPAALVGLHRKGRIAAGYDADLVVLAPDETFTVGALHHRNPITPYAGRELHGRVRVTWLRGAPVNGGPVGDTPPRGRLLTRQENHRWPAPPRSRAEGRPSSSRDRHPPLIGGSRGEEDEMSEFRRLPDLAVRHLGGSVVYANDDAFAARQNLITPGPAVFDPSTFGPQGKVYDGWETRRRREPGHDAAIVRLGAPGVVRGVVIDTSWFTGNYPPEASVEGVAVDGHPSVDELASAAWAPLLPRTALTGDTENAFAVDSTRRVTHVRLRIFPDGGVARLRVHGEAVPDPALLDAFGTVDLAALEHGGVVTGCSNLFYSSPNNLLLPGPARSMGEGWETARRRDDGNDWVELALAAEGTITVAELDTSWFLHNAPGEASLRGRVGAGEWFDLLPRVPLRPDTRHRFVLADPRPVDRVRLDIHPDGGLARLRLHGRPTETGRTDLAHRWTAAQ